MGTTPLFSIVAKRIASEGLMSYLRRYLSTASRSDYIDYMGFTIDTVKGTPLLTERDKEMVLGLNATNLLNQLQS